MNKIIIILLLLIIIIIIIKFFKSTYENYTSTPSPLPAPTRTQTQNLTPTPTNSENYANTWSQCDGEVWTGSTRCCTGSNCVISNDWYSQCMPTSS